MAYVAPNGNITLYKCPAPLNPSYNHTLWFSNAAGQAAYFNALDKATYTHQMYTRAGRNKVRVEGYAEHLKYYNYMSFSNDPHSSQGNVFPRKTYYAFITKQEYINEHVTEITFVIDEMQTWLFDIRFNQCFIERQHAEDDTWGINIEPETLVPKEYISSDTLCSVSSDGVAYVMCIGTYTFNSPNATNIFSQHDYSGLASTVKFIYFKDIGSPSDNDYYSASAQMVSFINMCNFVEGAISGLLTSQDMWDILGLYVVPTGFFNISDADCEVVETLIEINGQHLELNTISPNTEENVFTLISNPLVTSIPIPTRHGTNDNPYEPENKKLLTYPYTYLSVETPLTSQDYKYELFPYYDEAGVGEATGITFKWRAMCNPQPGIIVYPIFYKNDRNPYHYAITVTDFPQLPVYSGSIGGMLGKGIGGAIKMGIGALLGGAAGALASQSQLPPLEPFIPSKLDGKTTPNKAEHNELAEGISDVGYAMAKQPPNLTTHGQISGGAGCTELGLTLAPFGDRTNITFRISIHQYGLLKQTAKRFDMFLSKYGYAQNKVGTPNIHARKKWTYIKTRDCCATGFCPQDVLDRINKIMDSGITFWADTSNNGVNVAKYTHVVSGEERPIHNGTLDEV